MYYMVFRVAVSTQVTIDHLSNWCRSICDLYQLKHFTILRSPLHTYPEIACAALSIHPSAALQ
jgi:hypothetical protein